MTKKKVLRSKTFNTHIDGKLVYGFKAAYKFLESLPKKAEAWMESYAVGKNQRISRAVVYWYVRKS